MNGPAWLVAAIGMWAVLDTNSKLLAEGYGAAQVLFIRHAVMLAEFAGVAFAILPSLGAAGAWQGYAWAFFGAFSYAVIMTINRRLRAESSLAGVILWPSLLGAAATLPFMLAEWNTPDLGDAALLGLNGVISAGAMIAMTLAFRHADAARLAPFEYSALIFAVGFDIAIWGVVPAWQVLAGAAVVVAACLASERARNSMLCPQAPGAASGG